MSKTDSRPGGNEHLNPAPKPLPLRAPGLLEHLERAERIMRGSPLPQPRLKRLFPSRPAITRRSF